MNSLKGYAPNIFEKIWWPIMRFIRDFLYHCREVKYFFQRGKRGWSDDDWWNMDSYLINIILPMLKKLKNNAHGCPGDLTEEKWNELLDEMIIGFEAAKRVQEDDYYKGVSGDSIEAIHNATHKEIRQWGELSMQDQKLFKQKMKIFTERFFNLWD